MVISVLLTAWDRSEYLPSSIHSVLNQSVRSDQFELVVLSNIPNVTEIVDSELGSRPDLDWRVVTSQESRKGRFFADGFQACRGSIVSILNDDDLWSTRKLEVVSSMFGATPELGFHKHDCLSFRSDEGLPSRRLERMPRRNRRPAARLFPPLDYERLASLGPRAREFNDSTISIRSNVVSSQFDALRAISASEDSALFYMALQAKATVAIDSRVLSGFRLHPGNSSGSRQGDIYTQTESFLRQLRSHRASLDSLRLGGGKMDPVVASMLDEDNSSGSVWEAILTEKQAGAKLSAVVSSIKASGKLRRVPAHFARALIAISSIPAPTSSRRLALRVLSAAG